MSGHKESEFRLQREREERIALNQTLSDFGAGIESLRNRVIHSLTATSIGLRTTFSEEVGRAENWAKSTPQACFPDPESSLEALRKAAKSLRAVKEEGRRTLEDLVGAMTAKADTMGKQLSRRVAETESCLFGHKQLLETWHGGDRVSAWIEAIVHAGQLLNEEQYSQLEATLASLSADISRAATSAQGQEQKHQKRLYLLNSLRQVCAEMGFQESGEPDYEQPGQRGSAILYAVDTVDRGRILFWLTLDGVHSDSEVSSALCFDEFAEISKYLEEGFNIETSFRPSNGPPPPALKRKGERDLPEGVKRTAAL